MKAMTAMVVALMVSNVLLVGLLFWGQTSRSILSEAEAQATVARGGKYVMAASVNSSGNLCTYIIDETSDRMLVYVYDESRSTLRRLGGADLRADFQALGPAAPAGR